jgi:hypothetical protein
VVEIFLRALTDFSGQHAACAASNNETSQFTDQAYRQTVACGFGIQLTVHLFPELLLAGTNGDGSR